MQRFLVWLGTLIFGDQSNKASDELRATNARLRAQQLRRRTAALAEAQKPAVPAMTPDFDSDSELGSRIEDGGPGKNILVVPRRVLDDPDTQNSLKILDSDGQSGDTGGFDPYNTGQFDRSSNWSRVNRK